MSTESNRMEGNNANTVLSENRSFKMGQTVYHREVYEHKEPLKIVGITEDKLLLEGDYSGGTNNVCQRSWSPLKAFQE